MPGAPGNAPAMARCDDPKASLSQRPFRSEDTTGAEGELGARGNHWRISKGISPSVKGNQRSSNTCGGRCAISHPVSRTRTRPTIRRGTAADARPIRSVPTKLAPVRRQAADLFACGSTNATRRRGSTCSNRRSDTTAAIYETGKKNERAVQVWCPPAWPTYGWERRRNLQRTYRSPQEHVEPRRYPIRKVVSRKYRRTTAAAPTNDH